MTLISMRKLADGVNDFGGGPTYLCTFVDQRFFWWARNTGSLTVNEGTTTWDDLYSSMGTALEVTINQDPVVAAYGKPSSQVNLQYEPVPQWLDTIAQNVGQRVTHPSGRDGGRLLSPNGKDSAPSSRPDC